MTTATLRTYCVLFPTGIRTRRTVYWNVSERPDGQCVAQQFRNLATMHEVLPRYLIHDRDSKLAAHADELLGATGTTAVLLPPRSPDLSGPAERWIGMARNECLDRTILVNERHLRWARVSSVRRTSAMSGASTARSLQWKSAASSPCHWFRSIVSDGPFRFTPPWKAEGPSRRAVRAGS